MRLADTLLIVSSPRAQGRTHQCEPVTCGVPLPRGLVRDPSSLRLADEDAHPIALQALPTEYWPDGSIRWALLDFQVAGPPAPTRRFRLYQTDTGNATVSDYSIAEKGTVPVPEIAIRVTDDRAEAETGAARFRFREGSTYLFDRFSAGSSSESGTETGELVVTDAARRSWTLNVTRVTVEDQGPLRSTVRLDGTVGPSRRPLVEALVRVHLFAGSAAARIAVTLRNPRRARHRNGFWELGDAGSVYLREVSVRFALGGGVRTIECAAERQDTPNRYSAPLELYQDSSGGDNWRHATHVNRNGEVACEFRGYVLSAGGAQHEGLRATPAVIAHHAGRTGIVVERFWENFPKAIEVRGDVLALGLFPRHSRDLHELQGGEQKTHVFALVLGDDAMAADATFWGRMPAVGGATPEWHAACQAIPYVSAASTDRDPRYAQLVTAAIEGPDSFTRKREIIDEYGWRNFGDLYADHENAFSGEAAPIVSHYNNQYDGVGGLAAQFMRTGDVRWWRLMNDLATHVADIDIYHTDRDRAAYNHGLFWHTFHYVPAGRSSHRSYPQHPKVWGGGPADEHNYSAGLRLHWLLTGDRQSRDAAIELARWVLDMDDGRKTVLRWLSTAPTGLASATQSPSFHGPGRGAGHSILALLDGHRLTGEAVFLTKAAELVRRCVHPSDDIDALTLLDAERRWSYVVFLQALGKYVDYTSDLGQTGGTTAYAQAALLHYARWMAEHEYPYLEKPAILEFPTETWAAQDMRKSEVFLFAAQYAAGEERARFVERARFFFDYSVSTLLASETRALTRPLVLLLSNGFMYMSDDAVRERRTAGGLSADFERAGAFVPQKVAAKRRLVAGAALIAVIVVLAAIAVVL